MCLFPPDILIAPNLQKYLWDLVSGTFWVVTYTHCSSVFLMRPQCLWGRPWWIPNPPHRYDLPSPSSPRATGYRFSAAWQKAFPSSSIHVNAVIWPVCPFYSSCLFVLIGLLAGLEWRWPCSRTCLKCWICNFTKLQHNLPDHHHIAGEL